MNTNKVLEHIAETNPYKAAMLCNNYGFPVNADNKEAVYFGLTSIVDSGEEDAVQQVMAIHPEKDIILELFAKKPKMVNFSGNGCDACIENKMIGTYPKPFFANANGSGNATEKSDSVGIQKVTTMMQQNTLLMVGILAVVGAIVISKFKN